MSRMKKKVWIHGISGRVGRLLEAEIEKSSDWVLVGGSHRSTGSEELESGLKKADIVIDFSSSEGSQRLCEAIQKISTRAKLLVCATGLSKTQKDAWARVSENGVSVLLAPNTSIGIMMLMKCALAVAGFAVKADFDIEIEECHHRHKADSPSGTTLFLADALHQALPDSTLVTNRTEKRKSGEIGISVTRGGGVFGEHSIRFLGEAEEFTLSHRAFSRDLFAKGALALGEWLLKQEPGFYSLHDVAVSQS